VLNSILEGDETPSDVAGMIEQLGVHTARTVEELLLKLIAER